MSLRRGNIYAWFAGPWAHLWVRNSDEAQTLERPEDYGFDGGINLRLSSFDELVVMRLARMTPVEIEGARKRATRRFRFHFDTEVRP